MKNSVNQHSVLPVSFECIDGKRFRFHQIGPMTHLKKRFSKNFFFWKSWSGGGGLSPSHVFMFSLFMFSRTISNVSFEPANHFFIRCMHFDRVVHEVWPCNIQKGKQNWRTHQKVNKHWKYRTVTTRYKKRYSTKLLVQYRFVISVTCLARSSSRVLRSLSCPASIIGQPCSMRIRYRGSPSKSLFCEVLRSFLHSEGTTISFPIPRRKNVPWSLKHRVSTQVCFLRGAAIIFAFRSLYSLLLNISKDDCTVVAKTSSAHPGLFFARCCDHFCIPKPL